MRPPRQDWPSARHHVFNRGRRREPMFDHPDACRLFLRYLGELPESFDVRIHGYALMPNHYHLMLETMEDGDLSSAMQWLGARFVQHLNVRRGWDGAIFRGRFKNRVVKDDTYWRHLAAYVHLNPVKARLIRHPYEFAWTSHRDYVEGNAPSWLTCGEVLELHGGVGHYLDYLSAVQGGWRGPPCFDAKRLFEPEEIAAVRTRCRELAAQGKTQQEIADTIGRSRGFVLRSLD